MVVCSILDYFNVILCYYFVNDIYIEVKFIMLLGFFFILIGYCVKIFFF